MEKEIKFTTEEIEELLFCLKAVKKYLPENYNTPMKELYDKIKLYLW